MTDFKALNGLPPLTIMGRIKYQIGSNLSVKEYLKMFLFSFLDFMHRFKNVLKNISEWRKVPLFSKR